MFIRSPVAVEASQKGNKSINVELSFVDDIFVIKTELRCVFWKV